MRSYIGYTRAPLKLSFGVKKMSKNIPVSEMTLDEARLVLEVVVSAWIVESDPIRGDKLTSRRQEICDRIDSLLMEEFRAQKAAILAECKDDAHRQWMREVNFW